MAPGEKAFLVVGMEIRIGEETRLIAVDRGSFSIKAGWLHEFAQRLSEMVGGHREVERRTGIGREASRRAAMKHRKHRKTTKTIRSVRNEETTP